MRKGNGYFASALALMACGVFLFGCNSYQKTNVRAETRTIQETKEQVIQIVQEQTKTQPSADLGVPTEQERIETDGKLPSYLTGEMTDPAIANRRPLAIMMSNDKAALPQYGINRAGVVYEAPVEGGMNRYMALIEDYDDLERIGSVRSCRTYYTYFSREFEGVYTHFGQSDFALPFLKQMEHINGIEGKGASAFYRTTDRRSPHNAYTSGARVNEAMERMGISHDYPKSYQGHYRFAKPETPVLLEEGFPAEYVRPGYVINNPWFEYNKEDGLYYRYQYGAPHQGDEGQIAVKNILFQYCHWKYYEPSQYLDINLHTPNVGYYFTNGRGEVIHWEKESQYGVTHYYDENGQEILLNPGKTWVCVIQTEQMNKAEYHGNTTQ